MSCEDVGQWLPPLDRRALDCGDRVHGDDPVCTRLSEGGAEDASNLGDGGGREPPLLHPEHDGPDVVRPQRGDLDGADDGEDLSADVARWGAWVGRPLQRDRSRSVVCLGE